MSDNFQILDDDEVNDEDLYLMKWRNPKDLLFKDVPRRGDEHIHKKES